MIRNKMMSDTTKADYRTLMLRFLPRVIRTEEDYENVQGEVDRLVDQGELTQDEADYLDLLGTLLREYEQQAESRADYELRGVALIRGLLELYELKQQDLTPIFKTKSIPSAVLHGKRRLTVEQIDRLAHFFGLPHSLFFEPSTNPLPNTRGALSN
jgi:HTH-type transcriptional regulator / antitoxin HigA